MGPDCWRTRDSEGFEGSGRGVEDRGLTSSERQLRVHRRLARRIHGTRGLVELGDELETRVDCGGLDRLEFVSTAKNCHCRRNGERSILFLSNFILRRADVWYDALRFSAIAALPSRVLSRVTATFTSLTSDSLICIKTGLNSKFAVVVCDDSRQAFPPARYAPSRCSDIRKPYPWMKIAQG